MKKKIIVPATRDVLQHDKKILDKPEIRVWCHPHYINKEGCDYYKTFETVIEAKKFIKEHNESESIPLFAFNGFEFNLLKTEIIND